MRGDLWRISMPLTVGGGTPEFFRNFSCWTSAGICPPLTVEVKLTVLYIGLIARIPPHETFLRPPVGSPPPWIFPSSQTTAPVALYLCRQVEPAWFWSSSH